MKHIIIARHTDNKISGEEGTKPSDGPITAIGEEQAKEMAEFLKNYELDHIFTSLYLRSIQTAEIINQERGIPTVETNAFNEYMMRPDGKGVEDVDSAVARTMSKLYSLYDIYDNILIVAHSSINQTMYRTLTNCTFSEASQMFKTFGEIKVLRYDYSVGDEKWSEVDAFAPAQSL